VTQAGVKEREVQIIPTDPDSIDEYIEPLPLTYEDKLKMFGVPKKHIPTDTDIDYEVWHHSSAHDTLACEAGIDDECIDDGCESIIYS
jgi:hypothetical protein